MPYKVLVVYQTLPKVRQHLCRWWRKAQRGLGEKYSLIFGVQFEIFTIHVIMFAQVIPATAFYNSPGCSTSVSVSAEWMEKRVIYCQLQTVEVLG